MRDIHCRDAGGDCDFVARGNDDKEILSQVGRHVQSVHGRSMTPELEQQVRSIIHDESSEAHKRSMAAAKGAK